MKQRIRLGQYEFPNPEWADVSEEGESFGMHARNNQKRGDGRRQHAMFRFVSFIKMKLGLKLNQSDWSLSIFMLL